jgi:hypothetical protein
MTDELDADDDRDVGWTRSWAVPGIGLAKMAPIAGQLDLGQFCRRGRCCQLPLTAASHAADGIAADAIWTVERPGLLVTSISDPWPLGGWVRQELTWTTWGVRLVPTICNDHRPMPASGGFHRPGRPESPLIHGGRSPLTAPDPSIVRPGMLAVPLRPGAASSVPHDSPPYSFCLERQSSPGNSHNADDYHLLEPGRPLSTRCDIAFDHARGAKLDHERRRLETGDARSNGEHRARQSALVRARRRDEQSLQVVSPEGHVRHQRHRYADGLVEDPLTGVPANLTTSPQRDPHAAISVNRQPVRTVNRDDPAVRMAHDRARERVRVIQVTSIRRRIDTVRCAYLPGEYFDMPIRIDCVQLPTPGTAPVDRPEVEASVPATHRIVQHHIRGPVDGEQMLRHARPQIDAKDRATRNTQPTPASPRYQGGEARIEEDMPMPSRFGIERDRGISVDVQHPQQIGLSVPHRTLAENAPQISHRRK